MFETDPDSWMDSEELTVLMNYYDEIKEVLFSREIEERFYCYFF